MEDVIIILGGGIEPDGSLPEIPKLRIAKGVELFKQGVAPKIVMSGKWGFWLEKEPPKPEAEAMTVYAISLGVKPDAILQEAISVDTIGNAFFCKTKFLEHYGWKNIVVVTSEYHIPRTKYIFEKVLGPAYSVEFISVDSKLSPEKLAIHINKENKTTEFLQKWFDPIIAGDTDAIEKLMYTKHPGYAKNSEITKEQLLKMLSRA